ncbi:hypothetical protein ACQCT5_04725 [Sutcliffiella halmapala]
MLKNVLLAVILIFILVGCSSEGSNEETITEEDNQEEIARAHLEEYLEFMKVGDLENATKYLGTTDNLLDVFEYTYLDLIEEYIEPDKTTIFRKEFLEDKELQKDYKNWVDMIDHYESNEEYETFTSEDKYGSVGVLIYWKEGVGNQAYKFLYDMEIANGLGNKLYKKVEFDLQYTEAFEGTEEGYKITKINIR